MGWSCRAAKWVTAHIVSEAGDMVVVEYNVPGAGHCRKSLPMSKCRGAGLAACKGPEWTSPSAGRSMKDLDTLDNYRSETNRFADITAMHPLQAMEEIAPNR